MADTHGHGSTKSFAGATRKFVLLVALFLAAVGALRLLSVELDLIGLVVLAATMTAARIALSWGAQYRRRLQSVR